MKPDNLQALARLRASTRTSICASELLLTCYTIQDLLDAGACDVVMTDPGWAGGISECRRIANLAEARNLGVIFHDCTGPVTLAAGLYLAVHCSNTWMQEIVRSFTLGYYRELVDHHFEIENGRMKAPESPGLGVAIRRSSLDHKTLVLSSR
jgi:galactonate dehydratase